MICVLMCIQVWRNLPVVGLDLNEPVGEDEDVVMLDIPTGQDVTVHEKVVPEFVTPSSDARFCLRPPLV